MAGLQGSPNATPSGDGPAEGIVVQQDTVLLDQEPGVLAIQVGTDQLIVETDGSPVSVEAGSVVVGSLGGGYLRRVSEVLPQGDRLVLRTERADLSDAILHGRYHASAAIADRAAHTWDIGGRVVYSGDVWSNAEGDYVNVNVHIAEGAQATVEPNFDFDIELFNGNWIDAGFQADIALDYNADFVATVDGAYDDEIKGVILTREIPFSFNLGPVPVVGMATVEIEASIDGAFVGGGTTTLHTEAMAYAMLGAGYNDDGWYFDRDGDMIGDIGFVAGYDQSLQTRAHISAHVTVDLYDAAGAELYVEPWLEVNTCQPLGVDVDGGVQGLHRYYFEAFGWFDFDSGVNDFAFGPWNLYELQCEEGF